MLRVFSLIVFALSLSAAVAAISASVGGLNGPTGERAICDLPESQHLRNAAGRDGSGLCVFTSLDHSGRWHNNEVLIGMRDYMKQFPGGGWPEKVDEYVQRRAKQIGKPVPKYVHIQSTRDLDLVERAVKAGFLVCVTYYRSPSGRYDGRTIYHMVNLISAGAPEKETYAILDNNYPRSIEWLTREEFLKAWTLHGQQAWAIIILEPPPPPRLRS